MDRGTAASVLLMASLLVMLGGAIGRLSWNLFKPEFRYEGVIQQEIPSPARVPDYDIQALQDTHLFGSANAIAPVSPEHQGAPETRLDLVLKGILFTENPADSRAIIAAGDNPDVTYAVGAVLPGDAAIEAMYVDRIVLRRKGGFETLFLSDRPETGGTGRGTGGAPKLSIDNRDDPEIARLLTRTRQGFLSDPAAIARQIQVEPAGAGKAFDGFRIRPGSEGASLLAKLGLQSGDLVTSVNGIELDSTLRGVEVIRELASTQELALSVRRKGGVIELRYKFAER